MKKNGRLISVCFSFLLALACLMSCNNPSSGDSPSNNHDGDEKNTVEQGIAYLKDKKFDEAYSCFMKAYASDKENTDAQFWATLLKIASVSTDDKTVALMKDRIGFVDYPSSMNALFSDKWFNARYYDDREGFYPITDASSYDYESDYVRGTISPSTSSDNYCYYYEVDGDEMYGDFNYYVFTPSSTGNYYSNYFRRDLVTYDGLKDILGAYPDSDVYRMSYHVLDTTDFVLLPRLEIPTWAKDTIGEATNADGDSASTLSRDDYFVYLALNLIGRNPDGLNEMIDSVLSGPFGATLGEAFEMIDALPDTAQITIPNDLLAAYTDGSDLPSVPVVLNKAELRAFAGSCKTFKAFVELLSSYNLNYPLAFAQRDFWSDDGSSAIDALCNQENPVKSGFMTERSASARTTANATLLSAIADYTAAANLLSANIEKPGYIDGMTGGECDSGDVLDAKKTLTESLSLLNTLKTSLNSGTKLYINPDAMNGESLDKLLSPTVATNLWGFNLSALFSSAVLDPRKYIATNGPSSSPTGLALYGMYSALDDDDNLTYIPLANGYSSVYAQGPHYFGSAVKPKWDAISAFLDIPVHERPEYIPLYSQDSPFNYSEKDWKPIKWIMGL